MVKKGADAELLDAAIDALFKEGGLRLKVVGRELTSKNRQADAVVEIVDTGVRLSAEIKNWAAHGNIGAIINQVKNRSDSGRAGLLVADYINSQMADRLKLAEVQYVDRVGNAYINQRPVYIHIKGNKRAKVQLAQHKMKTGKAFQPTGLKVVFAFLNNHDLIKAPYRQIAAQAQVALGSVGWVMRDLVAQGFLSENRGQRERRLENVDLLLDKWVEAYPTKLRQKHAIGLFTADKTDWWKAVNPEQFGFQWGGEIAAAAYTHYLNPRDAVVYIGQKEVTKFLQVQRLRRPLVGERPGVKIEL